MTQTEVWLQLWTSRGGTHLSLYLPVFAVLALLTNVFTNLNMWYGTRFSTDFLLRELTSQDHVPEHHAKIRFSPPQNPLEDNDNVRIIAQIITSRGLTSSQRTSIVLCIDRYRQHSEQVRGSKKASSLSY